MGDAPDQVSKTSAIQDPELRRFLDERLEQIRRAFDPRVLLFFGSRVQGHADEWSDIDLIIVSDRFEGIRFLDRMHLFHEEVQPHRHVDALCYTQEEFEWKASQPTIVREAVRDGVRVI